MDHGGEDKTSWEQFRLLLIHQISSLDKRLKALDDDFDDKFDKLEKRLDDFFRDELTELKIEIATLKTKLGVIVAIASLLASIAGGVIVTIASRLLGN